MSEASAYSLRMRIYPRPEKGGTWYVEFDRGKKRSLRTKDAKEAERRFKVLQREMAMGKLVQMERGSTKTLGEFRNEFVSWAERGGQKPATARMNRLVLDKLIDIAGSTIRLDRLTKKHLDNLEADCRRAKLSESSIDTYKRHAKAALGKAVDWKDVATNPFSAVKISRRKPRVRGYLQPAELDRFLNTIEDITWRRITALYCATGRRRRELLALKGKLIDMDGLRYCVDESKRQESEGWYPMTAMAVAVFRAWGDLPTGDAYLLPRVHPDTISHRIKDYLTRAGHGHVSLHGLRVSFGVRYLNKGGNLTALQKLLGHADYKTTADYYSQLMPDYLQDEAQRVSLDGVDLLGRLKVVK